MENIEKNWQDQKPQQRMEYLLKSGHLSDCSFVVYGDEGEKIVLKCHKLVLMSVSPVFERMFEGDFEESKLADNIVLDDVSGTDFQKFLSYLYWHDNQKLDTYKLDTIQSLIYLSKKFMIPNMTIKCLNTLKKRASKGLDPDTTIDLFEYAHQIEDIELIHSIKMKFTGNPSLFINTAAVFDLSSDKFLLFIRTFNGWVEEKIRFKVIEHYCNVHGLKLTMTNTEQEDIKENCVLPSLTAAFEKDENKNNVKASNDEKDSNKNEEKMTNTKEVEEDIKENCVLPSLTAAFEKDENKNKENEEKIRNQREQEKRMQFITELMEDIKFPSMSSYDFIAGPGASDLLTIEKKYQILSEICIAKDKMKTFV
ncbi:kelch-like protein 40 [Drosophila nasuta]|uniref:kelch-like protein 40 n=1 Tax=Drosophila nasuta TaxID=42062 RepID=UPI00295F502A|nr:kelch-like protein 40 [Drosophila nasuta]